MPSDPRTVAGLARVAKRLRRDWGITVTERSGWQSRGKGAMRPRVHVNHDTSDAAPIDPDALERIIANGHGSLTNSLSTWFIPRGRGRVCTLIAAGLSWHAGQGGWLGITGNRNASGTEAQRATGQTLTGEQLYVTAAIDVEMIAEFGPVTGLSVERVCDHREWTPRKRDRHGVSGWRARLRTTRPPARAQPVLVQEVDVKLIRIAGSKEVYVVDGTCRRHIPSRDVLEAMGWTMAQVEDVPAGSPLAQLPEAHPFVLLIRQDGTHEVYEVAGNPPRRRHVDRAEFDARRLYSRDVVVLPPGHWLLWIPETS